jgi:N-acetylneuraminate synthase
MLTSGRCLIIAEVGLAHDGSLGLAHAFIDAVALTGADAIKFQTHLAEAESTLAEPWRVKFSPQDATRFDYWRRTAFTEPQWAGLAEHARARDLKFLSSPFSIEAACLLQRVGVDAWKVASGEMANEALLTHVARSGGPVLLSSGLSDWAEIDAAVDTCRRAGAEFAVLQCTTAYPCPPQRIGLNVLHAIRERFGCPVGLSDHSGTIFPGIAAIVLGAAVVEVHVTMSREMFGPDVPASITTTELGQLVEGVRFLETALAHPVDKNVQSQEADELRSIFTRSVVARRDLASGHALTLDDLAFKKPGTGWPQSRVQALVGRRLRRLVHCDEFIREPDLEPEPIEPPR